jgi:hypothetical protein
MIVVVAFLAFGLVCAIAAWFVMREASKQTMAPRPPTYNMDEAYEWVRRHLDELVASTLTPDEVRTILRYQIDFFTKQGVTQNGEAPHLAADVVIGLSETVAYIVDRTKADGDALLAEQVYPVVETQLAYLRAIGAVGPPRSPSSG